MYYTAEEFKQISNLKNEIVSIITNKAASSLSPSLILLVETVGHRHFPTFCTKCSSGRFNILTRLYYRWLDDEKEKKEKNKPQTKNEKNEKSGDGKSVSKSNRKK